MNLALSVGGHIGEIDKACRPLLNEGNDADEDAQTQMFFESWCELAETLVELANEDEAAGRPRSAGAKLARATAYYQTAERMQARTFAPRRAAYAASLASFDRHLELTRSPAQKVEVPFGAESLPGILIRPPATARRTPCVIFWNGLDSTKEQIFGTGVAQELLARGIGSLIVDTPGSGEALRLRNLTASVATESWATACVDFLEDQPDIDPQLIGLVAWSLGGYYGPRATAFEPRLSFGVAWGSNYDWGQVQQQRLANQGDRPVPHYWDHVQWVWGCDNLDDFIELSESINLRGVADKISVPYLVVHGEHDRQIDVGYAHQLYADLTSSPAPALKIFGDREGGVEHCSVDNMLVVRDYICDWIDLTLASLEDTAHPSRQGVA
ncbi:hypothetical protein HMPREF0063_10240 [Aeromicrobium marinum DSM 15272]|uniref:Peptidase S9 prolyl oligopeptidase catalytic domain-containing protein n=1 Tax=Aeromicrobium marinum DSM 15272 TaxID=585531 RepID=E2S883_9ACTN|nr:hypothetical protein HMPREF0063_10240 [Aeromicrobium marinum DSM 15272]